MAALQLDEAGVITTCSNCGQKNRIAFEKLGHAARCGQCKQEVRADAVPLEVGSTADFEQLVSRSAVPVIVDYWAPWCGPCRMVSPELEKLAAERAGRLKLVKVNSDDAPRLSQRFQVQAIPTLLVMRDGKVLANQVGAAPARVLRTWLDQALASEPAAAQRGRP